MCMRTTGQRSSDREHPLIIGHRIPVIPFCPVVQHTNYLLCGCALQHCLKQLQAIMEESEGGGQPYRTPLSTATPNILQTWWLLSLLWRHCQHNVIAVSILSILSSSLASSSYSASDIVITGTGRITMGTLNCQVTMSEIIRFCFFSFFNHLIMFLPHTNSSLYLSSHFKSTIWQQYLPFGVNADYLQ